MEKFKTILKHALPWVITIGILGFIFGTQDYREILANFRKADLLLFIPGAIFILVTCYLLDCASQYYCLKWFCAHVPFRKVMVARGVSFLPMLINFNLGQAGMVYFFYRQTGKSLKSVAGAFIFTMHADLYALTTMFTVSIFFLLDQPAFLKWIVPLCALSWMYGFGVYAYWRWGLHKRILSFVYDWEIMNAFREARFYQYFAIWALRAPIFFMINGLFYLALISFGGEVPAIKFIVLHPLVLLVMGLPVAVAGLGITQAAWGFFFGAWVTKELSTALSLAGNFIIIAVNATIALICLPFGKDFLTALKQSQEEHPDDQPESSSVSTETVQD